MYPQYMFCFEQKYENNKNNQLKIVIFTAVKNGCILHGRVFVMHPGVNLHPVEAFVATVGCKVCI